MVEILKPIKDQEGKGPSATRTLCYGVTISVANSCMKIAQHNRKKQEAY